MIDRLRIRHFKSIRELDMDCSKVNVFIGEPNTGKSNILEVLGLLSWYSFSKKNDLKSYVRFNYIQNLFFDDDTSNDIELYLFVDNEEIRLNLHFENNVLEFHISDPDENTPFHLGINANIQYINPIIKRKEIGRVLYYHFLKQKKFNSPQSSFVNPPHGDNFFSVVNSNKKHKEILDSFFEKYGYKVVKKPQDMTFDLLKLSDDNLISYPYNLTSETLQRIVFYSICIESAKNSTLVFEEPESHAFPYYTKYLGEKIGRDPTNQYFIATHNPYLLNSIIEKTPKDSIRIFLTYYDNYETKVKQLSSDEVEEVLTYDPFLNLDHFLEEGKK